MAFVVKLYVNAVLQSFATNAVTQEWRWSTLSLGFGAFAIFGWSKGRNQIAKL
jgi:hypothetical protein